MENVVTETGFEPDEAAIDSTGNLRTRSFFASIGPRSETELITYIQNSVNAYENNGYLILGHTISDAGGGWIVGLSVGFYEP